MAEFAFFTSSRRGNFGALLARLFGTTQDSSRHPPCQPPSHAHIGDQTAAVSIPSNIGEGKRRKRHRALLNHLDIALGSQAELEMQLEMAERLGFAPQEEIDPVIERAAEVGRMLNGLIESLQPDYRDQM